MTDVLSLDHLHMLTSMGNLVCTLRQQGQLVKAIRLHQYELDWLTKQLGSEHPMMLCRMGKLALTLSETGQDADT